MHIKTKKMLLLGLLLITAAPVLILGSFLVKQLYVQHLMTEQLEKKSLRTITVNITDVKWTTADEEAEINGRMFDIKKFEIKNNSITLTGLYDEDEQELKKEIDRLLIPKKNEPAPFTRLFVKFVSVLAIQNINDFKIAPFNNSLKNSYPFFTEEERIRAHSVVTPPPNI
jgi:hypothetical protein